MWYEKVTLLIKFRLDGISNVIVNFVQKRYIPKYVPSCLLNELDQKFKGYRQTAISLK